MKTESRLGRVREKLSHAWKETKEIAELAGIIILAALVSLIPIKERKE